MDFAIPVQYRAKIKRNWNIGFIFGPHWNKKRKKERKSIEYEGDLDNTHSQSSSNNPKELQDWGN